MPMRRSRSALVTTINHLILQMDGSGVANSTIPWSVACSDPDDTSRSLLLLRALVEQLKGKMGLLKERNRRLLIENKALSNKARLKERNANDTSSSSPNNKSASSRNASFTNDVLEAVNDVIDRYWRWGDN